MTLRRIAPQPITGLLDSHLQALAGIAVNFSGHLQLLDRLR